MKQQECLNPVAEGREPLKEIQPASDNAMTAKLTAKSAGQIPC
jgi:hypothetical protein